MGGGELRASLRRIRDDAREADARHLAREAMIGQFAHALAHERGGVDGTFAGEDEVDAAQFLVEGGEAGKEREARLKPPPGEGAEAIAESTGGTRAGSAGAVDV